MLGDLGFFLLLICSVVSVYGCISATIAAKLRHKKLYKSSQYAVFLTGALSLCSAGILWYMLITHDYSVAYVVKNSSNDLPLIFRITAFWSAMEGSHFLWTLFITLASCVALATYQKDNEHIMPYVSAFLQGVMAWMFILAITYSDPFATQFPPVANGTGMNELLQNYYMAIHPPMLFIGYVALAVPAAYSIAALCYGDVTEGWLRTVRRWTVFAWVLLTAAITLGGRWAYVELGWGGYWAWDPVENSSLMPWLFATASMHSLIVQDKIGQLKRLSIVLAVFGFFMCFWGTFITRSGVISSVHSFALSPIGPAYLYFLAGILLITSIIFAFRAFLILPSDVDKAWGISKESALMITQFLTISFITIIFIGTMFPVISEAITGQKITIQAPYFNSFSPFIGFATIIVMAFGNLMRFQSPKIPGGKKIMITALLGSFPLTAIFYYLGDLHLTVQTYQMVAQLIGCYLVGWCGICLTMDYLQKLKIVGNRFGLFIKRNLGYNGAYIAHIGFLIAILGFLGNYRGMREEYVMTPGQAEAIYGYQLRYDNSGIKTKKVENAKVTFVTMNLEKNGKVVAHIEPGRSLYPTKPEYLHEVDFYGNFWHDIYISLAGFDPSKNNEITLQVYVNPTVRLVWLSVIIMCIGGTIALLDGRRGQRSKDVVAAKWEVA